MANYESIYTSKFLMPISMAIWWS